MKVLKKYVEDESNVTEYTKDGETISHTVRTRIQSEPIEPKPSIEEEILFENKYQTMLLEMGGM